MNIVLIVVIVTAILASTFSAWHDRETERAQNAAGNCAVQIRNETGGYNWVYRPCAAIPAGK